MSSPTPTSTNFRSILDSALENYAKQTGIDLTSQATADRFGACDTSEHVLQLLQERETAFRDFRNTNRKLFNCLRPVVQVIHSLSGIFGGLVPFPPTKLIFAGLDILLAAATGVSASYDALVELFDCIGSFLKRLHIYSGIPLNNTMMDILIMIMVEVLSVLALATKQIKQGRFKKFGKKLFGESDVEAVLNRLGRLTQEEARVTVTHVLEVVYGLVNNMKVVMDDGNASTDGIRQALIELQEVASGINKLERNQLQEKTRHWLHPPDPSTNHNIALRQHHDGTATWFIRSHSFKDWKATGSLLWVYGKPGSGKSILCSSVIQDVKALHDSGLALMTYFYCDFRDPKKQDVSGLLASLLAQLSAKSDPCHTILSSLYSKYDAGSRQPSDDELWECLETILKMDGQPPIYVIVDAVDECPSGCDMISHRELVLEFVEKLVGLHLSNVRICITSRPEADIRASLEPLASHTVSLHDEIGQKNDIFDYVSSMVHSDRNMRKWRLEDKKLVVETLSQKADGMFRWVVCQLGMLRRCIPAAIRRALDDLPESLDETYQRILLSIGQERRDYARRLFQCLAVSIRPLRVDEVADILSIQFDVGPLPIFDVTLRPEDSEEAILSTCSSLITILNVNGAPVVQFSHFSVKEYLISERLAKSGNELSRYHILPASAHTTLAQSSLSILLTLDDQVDKNNMKNFPLAPYAAQYWVDHAQFENVSSSVEDAMELLFDSSKPHFATWVWIYDIDYPFREIMFARHPTPPEAVPLYYATLSGFRGVVERLAVTCPEDVNARGGYYWTPLHAAIWKGNTEMAELLLAHKADVTAFNNKQLTALHLASRRGHSDIVESILTHHTDTNIRGEKGQTPLQLASQYGHLTVARLLLGRGAGVDFPNDSGWTPLMEASGSGHADVVCLLLEADAALDSRDDHGWTALISASAKGRAHIVRLVLQAGAAVDSRRDDGWTALMSASANGDSHIVRLLLEAGAAVDSCQGDGATGLIMASTNGHVDVVRQLLQGGADANSRDKDGSTSLILATWNGHLDIVSLLLEGGAAVDSRQDDGLTALISASMNGHVDVVRLLLSAGADADTCQDEGSTALMFASTHGHADVVRLLLEGGATVDSRPSDGKTSLMRASTKGHLDVVRLLLDGGAAVDSCDNDGWTALMLSSRNGHLDVVRLLLQSGATVNFRNDDGWTALTSTSAIGHANLTLLSLEDNAAVIPYQTDSLTQSDDANPKKLTLSFPIHLAPIMRHLSVAELLIECRADVDVRNGHQETHLHLASGYGQLEIVRLLLKSGANPNPRDRDGWTPLHKAAQMGHLEITRLLLESGAEISTRNGDDETAFDIASRNGKREVAKVLAESAGGMDFQDARGNIQLDTTSPNPTPSDATQSSVGRGEEAGPEARGKRAVSLHAATELGNLVIVQSLLDDGAEVDTRDAHHQTPLHRASCYGKTEVAMLLIKYGADINSRDNLGCTSLHLASLYGHVDLVRLMLDHGADVNVLKQDQWTALHLATLFRRRDIVRLLLERGANVHVRSEEDLTPYTLSTWNGSREIAQLLLEYGALEI